MTLKQSNLRTIQDIDLHGRPKPGSILAIRYKKTGQFVTLSYGKVELTTESNTPGSRWECIQSDDRHGFCNTVSGMILGRSDSDLKFVFQCWAKHFKEWERFRILKRDDGTFTLLVSWWGKDYPIGIKCINGVNKMAMIEDGDPDEFAWEVLQE